MKSFFQHFFSLIIGLNSLISIQLRAQIFEWEQYSSEYGLSQNMVHGVCQDKKGFLWVGTRDGLNRFDGYRFKTYRYDPFDSLSLSGNEVFSILEDRKGRLWIATNNGINLFNREKEEFYKIKGNHFEKSLSEDPDGNIWQGGSWNGLIRISIPPDDFTGARAKLENIRLPNREGLIYTPVWDNKGSAFVGIDGVLHLLEYDGPTKHYFLSRNFESIKNLDFRQYLENTCRNKATFHNGIEGGRNGKIWSADKNRVVCWDHKAGTLKSYAVPVHISNSQHHRSIWDNFHHCLEDTKGRFWLSGFSGSFCLDTKTGNLAPLIPFEGNPESLFYYGASQFIEDNSGLIWVGSRGNGLLKYDEKNRRFSRPVAGQGLWKRESVRGLLKTRANQVWITLVTGELLLLDSLHKPFDQLESTSYYNRVPPVNSIFEDAKGTVWMGSFDQLLQVLNVTNNTIRLKSYPDKLFRFAGKPDVDLKQMADDKEGNLWITCSEGLIKFHPNTGVMGKFPFNSGLYEDEFPFVFIDRIEQKWVCTANGLLLLDEKTGTFKRYQNDRKNPASLSQNVVKCIAEDPFQPEKYLWVGTAGGGLNRMNLATKTFEKITEKDGLPDMVIYSLLTDEAGKFWMSTNKGLCVMDVQKRTFRNFDQFDGLQDLEFNSYAFAKAKDGQMLFGGIKGFNAFYPKDMLQSNQHVPEVVFTEFRIANKAISLQSAPSVLNATIPYAEKIVLSPDVKIFSLEFAALDFADPFKNQFACFMEGFDSEWQKLGTNHSATYTNLSPGTYTFRVKASNNDGVWNEKGSSIVIEILSPWYATWWAYLLYAGMATGVLSVIFTLEINRNKAKAEAKKFEEVSNAKSLFINTVSHELRTPLTSILGFSKIIKKRLEERILPFTQMENEKTSKAADQVMENLNIVISESERLSVLINDVLDLAKIESGKLVWAENKISLSALIPKAERTIDQLFEQKNLLLKLELEPNLPETTGDEDRILQVLINLLSNALKFTPSGQVICRAFVWQERFLKVEVEDTGVGIPSEYQEFVFEKFGQALSESFANKPQGTGLGLSICKEIIEHHGGQIHVKSEPGVGSIFSFTIPIR